MSKNMEHSHKSRSHAVGTQRAAALLGFGFVFASAFAEASPDRQSQALYGHAPSLSLAKTPKSLAAAWLRHLFKCSSPLGPSISLNAKGYYSRKWVSRKRNLALSSLQEY
jgi:hypothetical protein